MNIAHLLPHTAHFPLKKHNGRYEWAIRLARHQANQGHTVTMYASPNSSDDVENIVWTSTIDNKSDKTRNNIALITKALQNHNHDIYHSHFDSLHYSLAHLTAKPIVCTQHWFPTGDIALAARSSSATNIYTIPVTRYMEQKDKQLDIKTQRMIYHGIDLSLFAPSLRPILDRFIFIGRITPTKGVWEAVQLAKETNIKLDIIGKVNDTDQAYWNTILPFIDGEQIRYFGPMPQEKLVSFLQNAKAFIFPNQHEEAFGQVIIEAEACGTPAIISNIGASVELVKHSETGFVCTSEKDFINAIKDIDTIDRDACRKFAKRFSNIRMFQQYDNLYLSLIS